MAGLKMFREFLIDAAQKFGVTFNERQLNQFEIFYKAVVEYNEKINLTAIVEEKDFAVKHIIDSLAKRVDFLKKITAELELGGVTCLHGRAEDFARDKNLRGKFDIVTARAVARLNVLAEYCLPFVKIGGTFTALKGKVFREEIVEAEHAIKILGGGNIIVAEKTLPDLPDIRAVIYIDKKIATPKTFPRRAGIPSKNPLI